MTECIWERGNLTLRPKVILQKKIACCIRSESYVVYMNFKAHGSIGVYYQHICSWTNGDQLHALWHGSARRLWKLNWDASVPSATYSTTMQRAGNMLHLTYGILFSAPDIQTEVNRHSSYYVSYSIRATGGSLWAARTFQGNISFPWHQRSEYVLPNGVFELVTNPVRKNKRTNIKSNRSDRSWDSYSCSRLTIIVTGPLSWHAFSVGLLVLLISNNSVFANLRIGRWLLFHSTKPVFSPP